MKTMTCNQLGGACDKAFTAANWEEMVELSKQHGMEMMQAQDPDHLAVMAKMGELMLDPTKMQEWFEARKAEFEALPED